MAIQPVIPGIKTLSSSVKAESVTFSSESNASQDAEGVVNLQAEIQNASDELADLLSTFGRFARNTRKTESTETDPLASLLDEGKEEKLNTLVKFVSKLRLNDLGLLNFARSLFPNDSDLMLALKELLLYRRLSELQKKKVQEAINELKKYADQAAMQSGINVAKTASRFAASQGGEMTAGDLRAGYLRFLASGLPAGYIYQDWIEEFGIRQRRRLLAFMLSALAADMRASEPGIHFEEFGPLSAALTNARVINTLDEYLIEVFTNLPFFSSDKEAVGVPEEQDIVNLYLDGLVETEKFTESLDNFSKKFMGELLIKQRARVIQELYGIFKQSPEHIYADDRLKEIMMKTLKEVSTALFKTERSNGFWKDYYR